MPPGEKPNRKTFPVPDSWRVERRCSYLLDHPDTLEPRPRKQLYQGYPSDARALAP